MFDLEKEKNEIISNISEKIKELNRQIEEIKDIKIEPVDGTKWKELSKILLYTGKNDKRILLEIAKATFPNGTNWATMWQGIYFEIRNLEFCLKNNKEIKVCPRWYSTEVQGNKKIISKDKGKPTRVHFKTEEKYKLLVKLIESNNYNYYSIGKILRNNDKKPFKRIRYFFLYMFKWRKKLDYYYKKSKEYIEEENKCYKNEVNRYYKRRRNTIKEIRELKEILPQLEQFGEINIHKDSIINFQETINNKPLVEIGKIKEFKNQYNEFINEINDKLGKKI